MATATNRTCCCRKAHTVWHSAARHVRSRSQGHIGYYFNGNLLASLIHLYAVTSAVFACRLEFSKARCRPRHRRCLCFALLLVTGNLGLLLLVGLPGVHTTVHVPATSRNFRPYCYPVSFLYCPQARAGELFVSQVESKGRGRSREEPKKYTLRLYIEHTEATTSVSRNSCGFGAEQETRSAKEDDDEKRRKTEELKNRRITTVDEWKKQRYAKGAPGQHVFLPIVNARQQYEA